jgi:16S rRNA processing protein RimM
LSTEPFTGRVELLEVGRIIRPHGLRGEVVVELVTNRLERLAPRAELFATHVASCDASARRDGGPSTTGSRRLVVASARPHGGRYLVRFEGVEDIDAAERLRGVVLAAHPIEDPEALFVHDLIGSTLVDAAGRVHGQVVAVEANPASDLLVLEDGQLVPLVFVVAHEPGRVVVDVPVGLLE